MSLVTLQHKSVITRKEHMCHGCVRKFPAGSKMTYSSCAYDGGIHSSYMCDICSSIGFLTMDDYDRSEGFPEGFVSDGLRQNETPEQYLERLKAEGYC